MSPRTVSRVTACGDECKPVLKTRSAGMYPRYPLNFKAE